MAALEIYEKEVLMAEGGIRKGLKEAIEHGHRVARATQEHNEQRRIVVDALSSLASKNNLESLAELIEEHADDVAQAEKGVTVFGDNFSRFFGHKHDSGDLELLRDHANWMLRELEKASLHQNPVMSIAEFADSIRPLSQAIYERARIDLEAADAIGRWGAFARRAREAAPVASRLAAVLEGFGDRQETFEQLVGTLQHQQGVADTFEGLLSLLAKIELLARRAEDRQAAIESELSSVFEEARQAGLLLPEPNGESPPQGA